jgi:prepilin-type N-terminal cleavage/methylation domain-containing protein
MTRHLKVRAGFTLLEMLVVIAIIAILAAILFPALQSSKNKANRAVCMNNLKQINTGLRMYSDDSDDKAPRTPGTTNSPALNWIGYKTLMKSYVGINGRASPQDKIFACPKDTFYYDVAASTFQYVPKGLHEQPPDYLSYGFNGGNARTNSNAPGIAGRALGSIANPSKTVLVAEFPAFIPYSWHRPKPASPNGAPMFDDAMNMVSFVDGHVSYIKSIGAATIPRVHWHYTAIRLPDTITNGAEIDWPAIMSIFS